MADPGRGLGGLVPPYFLTKMRPEGPEKIFWETKAPLSQGLDDRPPPPPRLILRSGSATELVTVVLVLDVRGFLGFNKTLTPF